MTITKALRKLYKVIVGEEAPANANTITKVLLALAEAWTGSGGGGGGTEPLIIHSTEEEVKDPRTQKIIGYKTDTLASDAYEAWQSGRPIYFVVNEEEWLVSSAGEHYAAIILRDISDASLKVIALKWSPFSDGYLILEKLEESGDDES